MKRHLALCVALVLSSCSGEDGPQGPPGRDGLQGAAGPQGERGPPGAPAPAMPRLRYLLFGDSITETATVLEDGTYTEGVFSNWPTYFAPLVDAAAVVNYAKSGATYRDRAGVPSPWQQLSHQVAKAIEHGIEADVVIVAAGTNDGIGLLGDYATAMEKPVAELDRTFLYDALRWTFFHVRSAWPDAACFAALPPQRADVTPESRAPLNEAIRQMAQRYGCLVVDAAHESGIVADFEVVGAPGRYLKDGLHPNDAGKVQLARLFARAVRNVAGD